MIATPDETRALVTRARLYESGCGAVDALLLSSGLLTARRAGVGAGQEARDCGNPTGGVLLGLQPLAGEKSETASSAYSHSTVSGISKYLK